MANWFEIFLTYFKVMLAFNWHQIVPDVMSVAPSALITITWLEVNACLGNTVTPTQSDGKPNVTWNAEPSVFYTLLMLGIDTPPLPPGGFGDTNTPDTVASTGEKTTVLHWMATNIPGSNVTNITDIKWDYRGPGPNKGSGLHRYVFLVYEQVTGGQVFINVPAERFFFDTKEFVAKNSLEVLAGNFIWAEWDESVPCYTCGGFTFAS